MENHEYKLNLTLEPISYQESVGIVKKLHQSSDTIPRTSAKECLGIYINDNLEGVITLGYGTRPLHTIKKLFPSLSTEDYYEIGRMCINNDFKTNTESQMLSKTVKYVKSHWKNIKLLFTWANGLLGKVGTVYQASNFLYGGYINTDCYLKDGVQMHSRGMKRWLHPNDTRKSVRPTAEEKQKYHIDHIMGKQFRYIYFTCGFSERKRLLDESPFEWSRNYPTIDDCTWKKWVAPRKWVKCEKPMICTDDSKTYHNENRINQLNLMDFKKE